MSERYRKPLFTDAELDSIAHHLETAAGAYDEYSATHNIRVATQFKRQAVECRELRRRIDERE